MTQAKVISKSGLNMSGRIVFEAPGIQTRDACVRMQIELGFDPAGYDGPWGIRIVNTPNGKATQWECSASCD
jgi:hypothetical protein